MSVKISHPPIPNNYQSTIGDLQKLAESEHKLKSYFLAQKTSRQQNLGNLEDIYKPLLTNQNKQINEAKVINNKLDESKNELTNILQQLVVNGNLSTAASNNIIAKLDNINDDVLTNILYITRKKPVAIALLNTLNKYPNVVKIFKSDNVDDLDNLCEDEKKIFYALQILDDKTLKILVDYYSNVNLKNDVFNSQDRPESKIESIISEGDSVTDMGEDELAVYERVEYYNYNTVTNSSYKNDKNEIKELLNDTYPIDYEGKSKDVPMRELWSDHLVKNDIEIKKSENPWKIIKNIDNDFFSDLEFKQQAQLGSGIKFLSSDPKVSMNKLKILLAKKVLEIIMYLMKLAQYLMN